MEKKAEKSYFVFIHVVDNFICNKSFDQETKHFYNTNYQTEHYYTYVAATQATGGGCTVGLKVTKQLAATR